MIFKKYIYGSYYTSNIKKNYDLHKDTNFWLERNEIRNAVLHYEKVAKYLWDIDEEYSQKLYDFIHKMEDEMYY